jgi:hypothetical protein
VTAAHNRCWREIMGGITKHGSAKRSIEILEHDKEQTLKTLWREEKLDELFFFGSETRQRVSSQRSRGYASAKRDRIAASREGYFMRLP